MKHGMAKLQHTASLRCMKMRFILMIWLLQSIQYVLRHGMRKALPLTNWEEVRKLLSVTRKPWILILSRVMPGMGWLPHRVILGGLKKQLLTMTSCSSSIQLTRKLSRGNLLLLQALEDMMKQLHASILSWNLSLRTWRLWKDELLLWQGPEDRKPRWKTMMLL